MLTWKGSEKQAQRSTHSYSNLGRKSQKYSVLLRTGSSPEYPLQGLLELEFSLGWNGHRRKVPEGQAWEWQGPLSGVS
jgi:hypothetical protein